ncbi:hypothetical protein BSNT_08228 [Bacillus subtilis subsp. natto BEST195]|nr:hypothetical protein BSNT_08228 [Bacillus subtilis subsp. natto BEST195]
MTKGGSFLNREFDFCKCENSSASNPQIEDEWGYWFVCNDCNKKIEDDFHYFDEPDIY